MRHFSYAPAALTAVSLKNPPQSLNPLRQNKHKRVKFMKKTITPNELFGEVDIIESKSQAHRLLICAALSDNPSEIICRATSEDIDATVRCLNALGAQITRTENGFSVNPISDANENAIMDCGESGSTLRFLLPVVGALGVNARLRLSGRLPYRPLEPLWSELCTHGMTLSKPCDDIIECSGRLQSGAFTLPGNISSQYISGLLFALPLLEGDSRLIITGKTESQAYIKMTTSALGRFNVNITPDEKGFDIAGGQRFMPAEPAAAAEGDWSNAAFWLCAGALSKKGVICRGLDPDSLQGDKAVIEVLRRFGAEIEAVGDGFGVKSAPLTGCVIDAANIPDLVPVLAVCACAAQGETRIINAERLRIKESDRLKTVSQTLGALGADITETADGLIIQGCGRLRGGAEVDACGDHRIAMSAAVASCICEQPITITGAQAVNKSYPSFWEEVEKLHCKAV